MFGIDVNADDGENVDAPSGLCVGAAVEFGADGGVDDGGGGGAEAAAAAAAAE